MAGAQERHFHIRWEDILGHGRQKEELRRLLSQGRLPHALLLSGPEGVGKKLLGRVLAAAVLCDVPCVSSPDAFCAVPSVFSGAADVTASSPPSSGRFPWFAKSRSS